MKKSLSYHKKQMREQTELEAKFMVKLDKLQRYAKSTIDAAEDKAKEKDNKRQTPEATTTPKKSSTQSDKDKLKVSSHAIKRFKERVKDMPDAEINAILSADYLLKEHTEKNCGKYMLKEFKGVVVAINLQTVTTVYYHKSYIRR